MKLTFATQPAPDGLAQAFVIGADFVGSDPSGLILGDNIFYGTGLGSQVLRARTSTGRRSSATTWTTPRYGVVEFDDRQVLSIEEKPKQPKSNCAVPASTSTTTT